MARVPRSADPATVRDIRTVALEVTRSGRALHVDSLAPDVQAVGPDVDVLVIRGDVTAGSTLSVAGSVVVEGSVLGRAESVCRLDLEGEMVVVGSLRHADVRARRISVGKSASRSDLESRSGVHVLGDAVDVRIGVGRSG
ncbi:MAG: hypothetical protein QGI83_14320 [Candidatus Latescibacteria bacterium]|jgi:hypothetical protein|nr:hypothetical protein [Candidatus Latescibacterota bacterium]